MLRFNPARRITVERALAHPYIAPLRDSVVDRVASRPFNFDFEAAPLSKSNLQRLIYQWVCFVSLCMISILPAMLGSVA